MCVTWFVDFFHAFQASYLSHHFGVSGLHLPRAHLHDYALPPASRPVIPFRSCSSNLQLTILFPSETTDRANPVFRSADAPTQKETLSALYCRSMVLWQFVVRLGEAGGMLSQKATPRVDQEGAWMGQEGSFPSATPFSPTPGRFSPTSAPGTRDGGAWASEPRGAWPSAAGPSRSGENWSSERLRRDSGLQLQQINPTALERDSQTTVRPDSPWTPDEQVEAAQEAFGEAQAIEDALNLHTCVDDLGRPAGDADVVQVYLTREHIFK